MQRPLIACDDLTSDMAGEVLDLVAAAVDKFAASENYEAGVLRSGGGGEGRGVLDWLRAGQCLRSVRSDAPSPTIIPLPLTSHARTHAQKAAQLAKESLERKFGAVWHCIIGEVRCGGWC